MKQRYWWGLALVGILMLATSLSTVAQTSRHKTFSGVINAYSPQTPTTGPYEVRGPWSLKFKGNTAKADFSAALNMELSDGWVITRNADNFDPNARGAHTHHITMDNADVVTTATGFEVSGPATITLDGSPAPISPSPLVIDITGGSDIKFSNIALTFGVPGSNHFGTEPLPGVVRSIRSNREDEERH